MDAPPSVCPECDAHGSYEPAYLTGGGWRRVYRCDECGRVASTPGPTRRIAPFAVVGALAGAAWMYLRDRFENEG